MDIKVLDIYCANFVYNFLMDKLEMVIDEYDYRGKLKAMDEYLQNNLDIKDKAKDILYYIIDKKRTFTEKDYYLVRLGDKRRYKKTKYSLEGLLSLIEKGNLEIKGSYVIRGAVKYISENLDSLYTLYLMEGGSR